MGAQVFVLTYLQLAALLFALNHFPETLPKRWETISLYVGLCCQQEVLESGGSLSVSVEVTKESAEPSKRRTRRSFSGHAKECKEIAAILKTEYALLCTSTEHLYQPLLTAPDISSPLKPLILTPPVSTCCGSRLTLRNRPSFPLVYTSSGTYIAASYHSHCKICFTTYYPSFYEKNTERYLYDLSSLKYLQMSSQTGFEIRYLENVTNQLSICSSTFESISELYSINNMETDNLRLSKLLYFSRGQSSEMPWKLNPQRLEEGWFLYRIGLFYQERGEMKVNMSTELKNCRRDLEILCKGVYDIIITEVPRWIYHSCSVPGCTQRFAVLDGNEKITRTMCSAPQCKVKIPTTGISVMSVCPNTPKLGGNCHQASKYCCTHSSLEQSTSGCSCPILDLTTDPDNRKLHHLNEKEVGREHLDCQDVGGGCRKKSSVNHYLQRTAGIAAIVRPCGIIANVTEMYTCESMTQMYLFLLGTFARGKDIQHLKFLGYDRACGLEPFLQNLAKKDIYLAKYLLKNTKFLVDRFHVKGHTEQGCLPPVDNPKCKYHPDLPVFSEISNVNTECAEQAFRWLNKLKLSLRQMSRYKFNFYLYEMVNIHNKLRELHLKENKKLSQS